MAFEYSQSWCILNFIIALQCIGSKEIGVLLDQENMLSQSRQIFLAIYLSTDTLERPLIQNVLLFAKKTKSGCKV